MKGHYAIKFKGIDPEKQDWLIAMLTQMGSDGFEQFDEAVIAYVLVENFNENEFNDFIAANGFSFEKEMIAVKNWNALWESNFEPVSVDDFVFVRAAFHDSRRGYQHEILITPKMSFGTGHHATTYIMMSQMRDINFAGKRVFDFGTGTGVLAILAEKLGAVSVIAVDNDEWSIKNAGENIINNNCKNISLFQQDDAKRVESFDVILANINKNVILDNIKTLSLQLQPGACILFSGLLSEDQTDIVRAAKTVGLEFQLKQERGQWICMLFVKL
jgi:ribosomal protein L11 methyltransferase